MTFVILALCCADARSTTINKGLSTGCKILWIVPHSFLFGACGCGIIHSRDRGGESMRADPFQPVRQGVQAERPDEARLALRRAVQATLAGLAEMDCLLDKAEQLIAPQRSGCAPQRMLTSPIGP